MHNFVGILILGDLLELFVDVGDAFILSIDYLLEHVGDVGEALILTY